MEKVDISAKIGDFVLKNPIIVASGCGGFGEELDDIVGLDKFGAFVTKSISLKPSLGNPAPRLCEAPCGLINSIGLENIGLERFLDEKLPKLKKKKTNIIVSIYGKDEKEFEILCKSIPSSCVFALELNLSCPNVSGEILGVSKENVKRVVYLARSSTDLPIFVKLPPSIFHIKELAKVCKEEGACAISLINSIPAISVDIETMKPVLGATFGGLCGPSIKPISQRLVFEVKRSVDIPILGIGGIMNAGDVIEYMLCGASAVQLGTAILINPTIVFDIIPELENYLRRKGIKRLSEIVGKACL